MPGKPFLVYKFGTVFTTKAVDHEGIGVQAIMEVVRKAGGDPELPNPAGLISQEVKNFLPAVQHDDTVGLLGVAPLIPDDHGMV